MAKGRDWGEPLREIRIYFEGSDRLRPAFSRFFSELTDSRNARVRFVAGEGQPIRDFMKALQKHPEAFNLLLIDCEGPKERCTLRELRQRRDWQPPTGVQVEEGQVLLMVEIMESWFLADRPVLADFYGANFKDQRLPRNPQVEEISKRDVLEGLKEATRETAKGTYHTRPGTPTPSSAG